MKRLFILIVLLAVQFSGYSTHAKRTMTISFKHMINGVPLVLNNKKYRNEHGDTFTVSKLKYYVSNFSMVTANGHEITLPAAYYLVNAEDNSSTSITIADFPKEKIASIKFILGVDSARNVSGAQTGALDPANKMFWTWNSGYIFLKLEGTSPQSPTGKISFDIGGIKAAANSIRVQEVKIPAGKSDNGKITLKADLADLFRGKETIDFSAIYKVMGGAKSVKIADNYGVSLFSFYGI
ncbi:MbnP family protein [Chitinophaga sp. LS1]|uniref:MbnP family protein n=1 Tax=Chitinophaga sp. LS1 TaxID=3051176 RepID=UPI002AABDDB7|nr:MbnP family protein [Chitinophaga sp. LS1]WPV63787.1 hypothetical protein QQL36_18480 [Chitinophaga sp. LS1]